MSDLNPAIHALLPRLKPAARSYEGLDRMGEPLGTPYSMNRPAGRPAVGIGIVESRWRAVSQPLGFDTDVDNDQSARSPRTYY